MVSGVSYSEMIKSAISSLDEREGSTRISIANFILESFDVNNCHEAAVKTKMRQNLRRMVIIFLAFINDFRQIGATGLTGYVRLVHKT